MLETGFENVFDDDSRTFRDRVESHNLRLHIRWERGIRRRFDIDRFCP